MAECFEERRVSEHCVRGGHPRCLIQVVLGIRLADLPGGILEVVSDHFGDTFRTVYTVRLQKAVYVLHAFQKKAKHGIATPKSEIDLVKQRLRRAIEIDQQKEV